MTHLALGSEDVRYGIAPRAAPPRSAEVETENRAIEVRLLWGDEQVLHVAHLRPLGSFVVGASAGSDYVVGDEVFGPARSALVAVSATGIASVTLPESVTGTVSFAEQTRTLAELRAQGELEPAAGSAGMTRYTLPAAAVARLSIGPLTLVVQPTLEGRRVGLDGQGAQWRRETWTAASFAFHAALLLVFYLMPPRPPSLSLDRLQDDTRLVQYLPAPEPEDEVWVLGADGGTGTRHDGEQGSMGERSHEQARSRYAIEGPARTTDVHLAAPPAVERPGTAGVIGVLQHISDVWNAPTSPYGGETALGADPASALGALMGDQLGDSFGLGGLGMRGTGRGGGGTGAGVIGLGTIGTIGHGAGIGHGSGYSSGSGGFRGRVSGVPHCSCDVAEGRDTLSREAVRRTIRRHVNEVRFCYEQELGQRPDLAGRVTLTLVIGATGAVQSTSIASSTLGSARVEDCVAAAGRRWTFPAPDGGGSVLVTYPFALDTAG